MIATQRIGLLDRQVALALQRQEHWNSKLSWTEDDEKEAELHPKKKRRRLAPADLTRMGLVNAENYGEEYQGFGMFCLFHLLCRLESLLEKGVNLEGKFVVVCGAGTARDLEWIRQALEMGLTVYIIDFSTVACDNAEYLVSILGLTRDQRRRVQIVHNEIEEELSNLPDEVRKNVILVFASQFFMVQKPKDMRSIGRKIGLLVKDSRSAAVESVVCIVHPEPEDNDRPVEWEGRFIIPSRGPTVRTPYRTWGKDTMLYPKEEIQACIESGYGNRLYCRVHKRRYYHQMYSFIELSPDAQ